MNNKFICGHREATFGGVVIACGVDHQCDACCRRERDALAVKVNELTSAAMRGGANKYLRDAIGENPSVSLSRIKAEAIGDAIAAIDKKQYVMVNGNIDPEVISVMGEMAKYADNLINGDKKS